MKTVYLAIAIILLSAIKSTSQNNNYYRELATVTTGNSGTGSNIDVVYHRLSLSISPDDATKTLTGSVVTYFKTSVASVTSLNFDLSKSSFNNTNLSILYHGNSCTYAFPSTGNTNIVNITLPSTIVTIGTIDSITINYKGVPVTPSGQKLGLDRSSDNSGNYYVYTLSESYEDRNWWPCKADMQDKVDSLDMIVTVPSTYWVAANGAMTDSSISGSNRIFKFKHRYPIASYLVSFAVAKFKKFYLGNVAAGSTNVPFVANIFPDKTTSTENAILSVLNANKQVFATFNSLYGDYPFANEKHGFYEFGFGGGMEHQTFSGLDESSFLSSSTMAHELAHQWFGDKVTMATWNHLWLAEGFATYNEAVAAEKVPALGLTYSSLLASNKSSARSNTSTSIYLTGISTSDSVWLNKNVTAVYDRGCMVASMLRCLLGDTKFFTACKNYLTDPTLQYKSATTSNLQTHVENQFGESMSGFFTEWIMKKGTPNYTVIWGKQTKSVTVNLTQTVTSSGTTGTASTFFPMPVVIKIADTINGLDTTVVIYHKSATVLMTSGNGIGTTINSNIITYSLSFTPNKIIFDPLNKTMATATITYSAALPIYSIKLKNINNVNDNQFIVSVKADEPIERVELYKSNNGIDFSLAGKMMLVKNDNGTSQYQLTEQNIHTNAYYKAEAFTKDNYGLYSNIVFVNKKEYNDDVLVYPNPANNYINIQSNGSNALSCEIYTTKGQLVAEKNITENNQQISTSSLQSGFYVVKIMKGKKVVLSKKILVKH